MKADIFSCPWNYTQNLTSCLGCFLLEKRFSKLPTNKNFFRTQSNIQMKLFGKIVIIFYLLTVFEKCSTLGLTDFWIRTAQTMKFSIKDFFSKCNQIHKKLQNWSHLLKKSLMEEFIFCAVRFCILYFTLFIGNLDFSDLANLTSCS